LIIDVNIGILKQQTTTVRELARERERETERERFGT
jgi:hypothetical protein